MVHTHQERHKKVNNKFIMDRITSFHMELNYRNQRFNRQLDDLWQSLVEASYSLEERENNRVMKFRAF